MARAAAGAILPPRARGGRGNSRVFRRGRPRDVRWVIRCADWRVLGAVLSKLGDCLFPSTCVFPKRSFEQPPRLVGPKPSLLAFVAMLRATGIDSLMRERTFSIDRMSVTIAHLTASRIRFFA